MNEVLKPDGATQRSVPATVETARPRRRSLLVRIAIVAALAVAAVFAWQRFEHSEPSNQERENSGRHGQPPQTVRVAPITLGDMPLTIDALGTVTPFETVTVRTQIAGNLQQVGFTEGQTVNKGDFLAQIDPRPYEAALAQAQSQLAKDNALLGQAQSDLARYQQLAKQDSIAQQQVADQAALVAQDKAAIAADQAMVKTAELNVGYTHIVSPITGRVGLRLVDPGNYLQPSDSTGIVVITQIDPISVVFTTPEDNLPRISARLNSGADLKVTVLDRDNVTPLATGTLTTYDSQIDVTTGTIRMRATFANPKATLFPNQFVNVRLLVDTMTGATLAPNAAIQLGASGNFVYLLKEDFDGLQARHPHRPGRRQGDRDRLGPQGGRQGGDRRRRPSARWRYGQGRRESGESRGAGRGRRGARARRRTGGRIGQRRRPASSPSPGSSRRRGGLGRAQRRRSG